jgi:hypothetical protein
MKTYTCRCGQRIFFENTQCNRCGTGLGLDPASLELKPISVHSSGSRVDDAGQLWKPCRNREDYEICNWLIAADSDHEYCQACRLNDVIPNLDKPGNLQLWSRLEDAKRRMLYSLIQLNLPVSESPNGPGLRFRFLEDQSRNPDVLEPFVMTGHVRGMITINLAEADDVARHMIRESMRERYRTLLGHFRHEAGHYYFDLLVPEGPVRDEFRGLFGDERADYGEKLNAYYRDGPAPDWARRHVSAYATVHPHEDWAESFAHYLLIRDALETGQEWQLQLPENSTDWIVRWMSLAVAINELNRSLGTDDAYPFLLADPVAERLRFIDRRIAQTA